MFIERFKHFLTLVFMLIIIYFIPQDAKASVSFFVPGTDYLLTDESNYETSQYGKRDSFVYGEKSLGKFSISCNTGDTTSYNNYTAYSVSGSVSMNYTYKGYYKKDNPDDWHLEHDGTRWLRNYDLGFLQNMGSGCIMVEKSMDGKNWDPVITPLKDYFSKAKSGTESLICTIPESEMKIGTYYRVLVAYRFGKRVEDGLFSDKYVFWKCLEEYDFFIASEKNYITIHELGDSPIRNGSTVTGFQIYKNGSDATVSVRGYNDNCPDYAVFTEPGHYSITIKTKLGKEYNENIDITTGLDMTELKPTTYKSERNKGFPVNKQTKSQDIVTNSSFTSLALATPKDAEIKELSSKYGIKGKSFSIYLKLVMDPDNMYGGWKLVYDNWGKNKKQKVDDVETGEIGKGALIVQTSKDGKHWINTDKGRYISGLSTTNYPEYYKQNQHVLIYEPSGSDIINGIYIRVLFAFQAYRETKKEYADFVEEYKFYLCSNELDAVTFHNLSLDDTLAEAYSDEDANTIAIYQSAESLTDGSYTTTGFSIDKALNPTVQCTVKRNNAAVKNNPNNRYESTGKYTITLTSAVEDTKTINIFVDRSSPEEAMQQYFGEGFITGKRIFSEGTYPEYEAGKTKYCLANPRLSSLPLAGYIMNKTTGTQITIDQSYGQKSGTIVEPGDYEAIFSTNKDYLTGYYAGDARLFTFRFHVIPEGTAPGPVINQKLLADYSVSTATDSYPVYYGLTYPSSGKGLITLAFSSYEAAKKYAYEYEKGTVEIQSDGTYRYNGSFMIKGQKSHFESNWDLTDAINYFAEAAIHKGYFNMTDQFTYLSLTPETIADNPNLKQLELNQSVTIFAENQKEIMIDPEALPLINDKPYAYLDPNTGKVTGGHTGFEFVTDNYGGIDSSSVTITDVNGQEHDIQYSKSVGSQLNADHCPSGIVTIHEETLYGDATDYKAVYIAPGENQTILTIAYTSENNSKTEYLSSNDTDKVITADGFVIAGINDPLDPYSFVIVQHNQNEDVWTMKDGMSEGYSDPGEYKIICMNRLGYSYSIPVTIAGEANESQSNQAQVNITVTYEGKHENRLLWIITACALAGLIIFATLYFAKRRGLLESKQNKEDKHV